MEHRRRCLLARLPLAANPKSGPRRPRQQQQQQQQSLVPRARSSTSVVFLFHLHESVARSISPTPRKEGKPGGGGQQRTAQRPLARRNPDRSLARGCCCCCCGCVCVCVWYCVIGMINNTHAATLCPKKKKKGGKRRSHSFSPTPPLPFLQSPVGLPCSEKALAVGLNNEKESSTYTYTYY